MLMHADLGEAAGHGLPAGARDGERDLADGYDVPLRQRPQLTLVVTTRQVFTAGVAGVAVADGERLLGDRLRRPPGGIGVVGEDAGYGIAGLVAVQRRGVPASRIGG
jgi:hypothetical protein